MYIVVYDISNPKRLRKISSLLKRYGRRVQKSVFECSISEKRYIELWKKLVLSCRAGDHVLSYLLPVSFVRNEVRTDKNEKKIRKYRKNV